MVVVAVVLMFLLFAVAEVVVVHRRREAKRRAVQPVSHAEAVASAPPRAGPQIEIADRYYHPAHTWAEVRAGEIVIGSDEIAVQALGALDGIALPVRGRFVRQGEPLWTLRKKSRSLAQVSPVQGTIIDVNTGLVRNPRALHESPYGSGWVAVIRPLAPQMSLRNLLHGRLAKTWLEEVKRAIVSRFSPRLIATAQDGGKLRDGFGEMMNDAEWKAFTREYFAAD